jgi:hypothetical protein
LLKAELKSQRKLELKERGKRVHKQQVRRAAMSRQ